MSKEKYMLQEVASPAQVREWLDLPKKIYRGNRNWVCPLDQDIEEVFDPRRNELFADGEAIRWVVRDSRGEVVGRIAAFYKPREGGPRGAAHGRLRLLRGDQRPAGC